MDSPSPPRPYNIDAGRGAVLVAVVQRGVVVGRRRFRSGVRLGQVLLEAVSVGARSIQARLLLLQAWIVHVGRRWVGGRVQGVGLGVRVR